MTADLGSLGMRAGPVVSCQADADSPLRGSAYMAAMARAAQIAGAVGLRANGPLDIAAIKAEVKLPVIGIYKIRQPTQHPRVYITPSFEAAAEVARLGCEIVALHVLPEYDRDTSGLKARMRRIKDELDVLVMPTSPRPKTRASPSTMAPTSSPPPSCRTAPCRSTSGESPLWVSAITSCWSMPTWVPSWRKWLKSWRCRLNG